MGIAGYEHTYRILTMRTYEELQASLPMLYNIILTDEEKDHIASHRKFAGLYCLGCEKCLEQCPGRIPIPDIMRAYMYAYGYRDVAEAFKVLTSLNLDSDPCSRCRVCSVSCVRNFQVAEKIADINRVRLIPSDFI